MYKLSLFCRASYIFNKKLNINQSQKGIEVNKILDYAFKLTLKKDIEDEPIIKDFINNNFFPIFIRYNN